MNQHKVLNDELKKYTSSKAYPFHMPGHKRNPSSIYGEFPIDRDITEIDGFDNLHHAEEILLEVQKKASGLYETKETFYSINGSTAALLSAISAATHRNGKILMARNSHKAVYHAAYLRNLDTVYLYPQFEQEFGINGGISPEDVDNFLKKDGKIEAVLVTSPTYDGVVSDIRRIAEICHDYEVPLIVDEAHGAHFKVSKISQENVCGYSSDEHVSKAADYFPVSAADLGADFVIQSVHKTLPAMTQTALLHRCSERVSGEKIRQFMGMYQTSSPSYILMASIDSCMEKIMQDGKTMFQEYCENLEAARVRLKKLKNLQLLTEAICEKHGIYDYDKSKILIFTNNVWMDGEPLNGKKLHKILREKYQLEMEMDAENYIVALTSVGDTKEGFERLCAALEEIDRSLYRKTESDMERVSKNPSAHVKKVKNSYIQMEQKLTIADAMERESQSILLEESEGKISAEFVYLYPPGIPILVPGEKITNEFLKMIERYKKQGFVLQGMRDYTNERICYVEK